jgi:ABC-type branched-subunit amino acid transport system ATPase component/ABC-type branched-subunit amino acid transport system permease subunit
LLVWAVIYFPWFPPAPLDRIIPSPPASWVTDANLGLQYALVAFSLVILTGWVGQISLGQGAFVGVGAFTTALLAREAGIPFPANLPLVVVITAAVAALLGIVALRVRGLYLAVATLIFAWMADAYLFAQTWLVGSGGSSSIDNRVVGNPRGVTHFDFSNPNVMYLIMLAAVAACWYAALNLRDSKTGRAFFAVRGSEMAAVSLGIDVIRYKLLAFALAGGICGVAGTLIMTDLRTTSPVEFQFTVSLFYLGVAVIGGLTSLGGAVGAGLLFGFLSELFFRIRALNGWLDVVTVGLLMAVLLGYPGGLGALGPAVGARLVALWHRLAEPVGARLRRAPAEEAFTEAEAVADDEELVAVDQAAGSVGEGVRTGLGAKLHELRARLPRRRRATARRTIDLERVAPNRAISPEALALLMPPPVDWRTTDVGGFALPPDRADRAPVLGAENVIVRFGGLTAVDDVSLEVRENEIVGLIGPNGAGKTTLFNAIAGLNEPTAGTIRIFGEDATKLPVHVRAQMGVGRTFQLIQLFPTLTVFDNLLVATHGHNPTGVFAHMALSMRAMRAEAEARRRVRLVVEMLNLEEVVDRRVAGLPFGILRQVEIARALVTEAPLLMLDEPASGLDNAETSELARLLYFIRAQLGVTILLIEHDVRLVTSVSDYIYVINRGRPLAQGEPAEIQRHPDVVAAYLGQAVEASEDTEAVGAGT